MDTTGAAPSTIHVNVAGVGSGRWPRSTARTAKVWLPSASALYNRGLVHSENADWSSEHSNRAMAVAGLLPWNVNAASRLDVGLAGMVSMNVSGGSLSAMVMLALAGDPT